MRTWKFADDAPTAPSDMLEQFSENPPNVYGFGHTRLLDSVVASLRDGLPPSVDGLAGRRSLELITAIYESIESGREVKLPFEPRFSKLGTPSVTEGAGA